MKTPKPNIAICSARPDEAKFSCCNHTDEGDCPAEVLREKIDPAPAQVEERPAYYHREIF